MFTRLFRKKDNIKAQQGVLVETKEEPSENEYFEDAKQDEEHDWEDLTENVDQTTNSNTVSLQGEKYKIWVMEQICCCINAQETVKVGALTDAS